MVITMSGTNAIEIEPLSYNQAAASYPGNLPLNPGKPGNEAPHPPVSEMIPDELDLLHNFIQRHLRPLANADVQCMLLWTEWVRFCVRKTRKFPRLILEQEFNYLVTGLFSTRIALDEHRGRIYPGLRYSP